MPSKVIFAGVIDAHIGPWIIADGTEQEFIRYGTGDVWIECVFKSSKLTVDFALDSTRTKLPVPDMRMYRARRLDSGEPVDVHVTLQTNAHE